MTTAEQLHQIADKKNADITKNEKVIHAMQRIHGFSTVAAEQGKYQVFLPYVSVFEDYAMNVVEVFESFQAVRKAVFEQLKEEGFTIQSGMNALGNGWLLSW